jgi:hypothetical protein
MKLVKVVPVFSYHAMKTYREVNFGLDGLVTSALLGDE